MALTPAEQKELEMLERDVGQSKPKVGGLTPQEQAEMQALEAEVGRPKEGIMDRVSGLFSSSGRQKIAEQTRPVTQSAFAQDKRQGQMQLEQFSNAATMGYLPQLQAAAQPTIYKGLNAVTGQNIQPDSYVDARDANLNRLEQQSQEFPVGSKLASFAGLGANALITPGMGPAKTILGGATKGALFGAGQGFLQNPGDVEGEVNPLQEGERLQNAKTGAKYGGLIGGGAMLGQKIGRFFEKAPGATKKAAEATAFKSSGAMLKDFRQAAGKDEVQSIGRFMLDEKLVQAGDTVEDVAQKAAKLNEKAGEELDKVYTHAAKALEDPAVAAKMPSFNPIRDKEEILKIVSEKLGDSVDGKSALAKLSGYLDELGTKYGDTALPPRLANDIKGYLDEAVNYARNPLNKQPGAEQAFYSARTWLRDRIEEGVNYLGKASGKPELAKKLTDSNRQYGYSRRVQGIAKDRVQRESANLSMGLTDRIAGGAGAGLGGIAAVASGEKDPVNIGLKGLGMGLLAAAGNKASKMYGSGLLANGLNKAQPMMNLVGAGGQAAQGLMNPAFLSRAAVGGRAPLRKKRGLIDKGLLNNDMRLGEGYEQ